MPELPDVEAYRRFFREHATRRRIVRVVVTEPSILRNASPEALDRILRGRRFGEPSRRGKWLLCRAGGPVLLLHFGMTGDLVWSADERERHRHDRLILELDRGELRFRDVRKLGGAWLAHDEEEVTRLIGHLGPDALEIGAREFSERLARRRGGVKAVLMDQRFVAGVGNLVADEVLWQARIHPKRRVEDLDPGARDDLYRALRRVLRAWTAGRGRGPTWLIHVRGEPGARCPRCRTGLGRIVAAGRTTYVCPTCQIP